MSTKRNGEQMTNTTLISPQMMCPIKIRRNQMTENTVSGCSAGD